MTTAQSLKDHRDKIEKDVASRLGYLLFAYARLELSFGLHLIWSDDAENLDELSTRYGTELTARKVSFLKQKVREKYATGSEAECAYGNFFRDFDEIRSIRNDLVHGRWGPSKGAAMICVVGIPTSAAVRSNAYTPEDLDLFIQTVSTITARHEALRNKWPV